MKNYYEVLGVSEQATENEIKKAYFSMVRRYTPERDPEKFQEIREAYEGIKAGATKNEPELTNPNDPQAVKLCNQIKSRINQHDYMRAIHAAEEALFYYPKESVFRYYLALAERMKGYTGKAVKNCELLVKSDPDNPLYCRELALAYMDRGYSKKAIAAYKKAYALGNDDPDLMIRYARDCENNDRYREGLLVLLSLIEQKRRWKREELGDILEAYAGVCIMNENCSARLEEQIGKDFLEFIREYTSYLDENAYNISAVFVPVMKGLIHLPQCKELKHEIFHTLERSMHTEDARNFMEEISSAFMVIRCEEDTRLGLTIKRGLEAFYTAIDVIEDSSYLRYAQLDVKLCMLEEMPGILQELAIVQTDFPEFYDKIRDFAEILKEGKNLHYLKEKLQKEYERFDWYMSGGLYYKLYPQEQKAKTRQIYDDEQPFVREGKKIGRNDPCPCGSGKKYKHCCGKNG